MRPDALDDCLEPGDLWQPFGPAPHPTDALPGTEEKIRVFAERVDLGVELFHPEDA